MSGGEATRPKPRPGELIYGCFHANGACGSVASVGKHVTDYGMDHWWVKDTWHGRDTRVRRESNGALYEVEISRGGDW